MALSNCACCLIQHHMHADSEVNQSAACSAGSVRAPSWARCGSTAQLQLSQVLKVLGFKGLLTQQYQMLSRFMCCSRLVLQCVCKCQGKWCRSSLLLTLHDCFVDSTC
jgi:hypothetical protein